jgi:hypothetical protein
MYFTNVDDLFVFLRLQMRRIDETAQWEMDLPDDQSGKATP